MARGRHAGDRGFPPSHCTVRRRHSGEERRVLQGWTTGASVQVDPQLAYINTAWWLEYATAAKLYNYPDKRAAGSDPVPEVASRYVVSNGGKRYTFFIRKGFRFSDGARVTARNFKYAIDRAANGSCLAGRAVHHGPKRHEHRRRQGGKRRRATDVRGVRVRGNRLIIDLTRPDGAFLSKITMPFFQATSNEAPARPRGRERQLRRRSAVGRPVRVHTERRQHDHLDPQEPYWRAGPGRSGHAISTVSTWCGTSMSRPHSTR